MAMRSGAEIFSSLFLGAVLLMLTSVSGPSCTNEKAALFETDVDGSVGEVLKKCSAEKRAAFETYLESFERIGRGILPYAPAFDAQPEYDMTSNTSKNILDGWMKRKEKELRAVFAVIEAAPVVPETCSFERCDLPDLSLFLSQMELQGWSPITFWVVRRAGTRSRHLVEPTGPCLTSDGPTSLFGDSAGYGVEYMKATSAMDTLWEQDVKEYVLQKHIDTLRITCDYKKDGATYTLQVGWNVPPIVFKDQRSMRQYLIVMGPGFYVFDADLGRTAFFCRSVENPPAARPLVDW